MDDIDQRGFDNPPASAYLDGKAAAAFLGVKRETLYAYASRGLVRSVGGSTAPRRGRRGRTRLYAREDLERLKARSDARSGHGPVAGAALKWGEPVLESSVTRIDETGPAYRGRPATELTQAGVSFEAAAELLWTGALPAARPRWAASLARRPLPPRWPPATSALDRLTIGVAWRGLSDPRRYAASPAVELAMARELLPHLVVELARARGADRARRAARRPSLGGMVAVALDAGRGEPDAAVEASIDRALLLCADHELNASAFAARVAASAGADLYACVTAAMATLSGSRHGGACDRVEALIDAIPSPRRATQAIEARLRIGETVPGFGHPLYPQGDPRAILLMEAARRHHVDDDRVGKARAVARAMHAAGREPPTLDFGLAILTASLGCPRGSGAVLFALGRVAGWVAHILEQRRDPALLRPRARYVGRDDPLGTS